MADRFQDRPLPDDLDRIDPRGRGPARGGGDGDPLAELARLIGQNDPFGGGGGLPPGMGRANAKVQPRSAPAPDPYRTQVPPPSPVDDPLASGPPPWMSRGGRPEAPRQPLPEPDFQQPEAAVHPAQRYGAEQMPPQPQYRDEPSFDEREQDQRYDDALFGQLDARGPGFAREQPFADDPYAFQDEGYEEADEEEEPRRGNGLAKVAVVLALAVIGTGAAFAYRTYMGSSRSGEPPIIRADNTPTKIITAVPSDGISKLPDRMASGDQGEKIVSREEAPMDVNSRSIGGPRVVFPPLNQSAGAAAASGPGPAANDMSPTSPAPMADGGGAPPSSGTLANGEPRRIKTLSVHGDQGDGMAAQAATAPAPAPAGAKAVRTTRNPPAQANASVNTPMSISPQASAPPAADKRMASVSPTQDAAGSAAPPAEDSGYLVSVSSQKTEADAQASFRALKAKYADAMGSYSPVIKRVDLPGKGVMYRAMVGPFDTSEAANQFCKGLQSAGGQCFVPRK